MWLQFIKCLINCKVNWTINSPAYMTLMIRCHGSPPLFTLFRPIAAHRTVSILEKKNCHLPCYLTTFRHGQCHFKFSYHIDQQNFIEFFTTCLSIVCFYEKRGFRTSFSHFHKLPMNNVVFNFTYLSYIQCFSGVASIEWKLLSKNSKVTGSCLPVHSGEGSYTSHFVNKISCFHR